MLELRVTYRVYACFIYMVIYTHVSLQIILLDVVVIVSQRLGYIMFVYGKGRSIASSVYRYSKGKTLAYSGTNPPRWTVLSAGFEPPHIRRIFSPFSS